MKTQTTTVENRPYTAVLKQIVTLYDNQKNWRSPSDSAVMASLRELKVGCDSLADDQVYFELLRRSVYFADIKSAAKKATHDKERLTFSSFTVDALENKFLDYYKHNYFTTSTHNALLNLKTAIDIKVAERERSAQAEHREARRESVSRRGPESLAGSIASLAPTDAASVVSVFINDEKTEGLDAKEEYGLFRERYSILLLLKKREKTSSQQPLTDPQMDLYKNMLLFAIEGENVELKLTAATVSDEEIFKVFACDEPMKRKVRGTRRTLEKTYPNHLTEECTLEKDMKIAVIKKMIEGKAGENSILLADNRLDDLLKLSLFLPAVPAVVAAAPVVVETETTDSQRRGSGASVATHPATLFGTSPATNTGTATTSTTLQTSAPAIVVSKTSAPTKTTCAIS